MSGLAHRLSELLCKSLAEKFTIFIYKLVYQTSAYSYIDMQMTTPEQWQ